MRWEGHVARTGRGTYRVLVGNVRERDHSEDPGVDGRIILRWIFRKWNVGGTDWIDLAQGEDKWKAHVNSNLRVPYNAGNLLTS
jgi:hypothetical protein